ncbi:MAG: hypothetical protein ACYDGT_09265 [Thermoleophilia bacterium]
MPQPFELEPKELHKRLEEMVDATFAELSSEFLLMPKGSGFLEYKDFRDAYEVLKKHTNGFEIIETLNIKAALLENSRVFVVVRTILGMTAPEWAELARTELHSDITQGAARTLDSNCRRNMYLINAMEDKLKQGGGVSPKTLGRINDLVEVATNYLKQTAPKNLDGIIHRLDKFDTSDGPESLEHAANENIPYSVLLYERYLGRPFASHRDSVSELVGEVMENAVEERLREAGVSYRKTARAERIPGFGQAPDFCIPDEIEPVAVIEAKITSDDGTARDKVARIKELETQRNRHVEEGRPYYEVIACIDGRGFRQRREDMRQLLLRLNGKVFTLATLDQLIIHSRIREFISKETD